MFLQQHCIYQFCAFNIVKLFVHSFFIGLCISTVATLNFSTFSPVLSDDYNVPFFFTLPKYDVLYIDDTQTQRYVVPQQPRMGVAEPFSGNPSGEVVFNILNTFLIKNTFYTKTRKIGNFFFLEIYIFNDANINREKNYQLHIDATFTSSTGLIKLKNSTEVTVHFVDRNENCPFFLSNLYSFSIYENITTYDAVGKLYAVDDDSGLNAQIFFYLDPTDLETPFYIDSKSGIIYTTQNFRNDYFNNFLNLVYPRNNFGDKKQTYNFKVYAVHRGLKSHVHCSIASFTEVNVVVLPNKQSSLNIRFNLIESILDPGKAGVLYAHIFVDDANPSNNTIIGLRIVEPAAARQFGLIRSSGMNEWRLVTMCDLPSVALNSTVTFTLEAFKTTLTTTKIYWNQNNEIISQQLKSIDIPILTKSKYKLFFPSQIYINVSEAAIVNSTIAILQPTASYNLTDANFVFKIFKNSNDDALEPKIGLTKSGALIVRMDLNLRLNNFSLRESSDSVIISLAVVDINNPLLSGAARSQIVVTINDINDNDPIVVNNGSTFEIKENAALGTKIFKIDAFDPDLSNTSLSYILYDSDLLPFNLSGYYHDTLIVSKALDAETMPSEFKIHIRVSDSGLPLPRSIISVFTVRILDVNEHSPQFVETSCESWLTVSDKGAIIPALEPKHPYFNLGRFTAEDADRDGQNSVIIRLATHSLSRPCFNVSKHTGNLSVTCSYLDPPGNKVFIRLLASDGVRDCKEPFTLTLNLISIHAAGEANFSTQCKPSHIYETLQDLKLRRREYDILIGERLIFNNIINRHTPQFPTDLPTRIHIPENLPLGTEVLRFAASDEDDGNYFFNGQIIYGLQALRALPSEVVSMNSDSSNFDADIHQAFILQPTSNVYDGLSKNLVSLVVAGSLDRERISSYSLLLHACDLGAPQFCSFSPLHIFLDDLDDNIPEFISSSLSTNLLKETDDFLSRSMVYSSKDSVPGVFYIFEDVQLNVTLGQVKAVDRDVTSEVNYFMLNHEDTFEIDQKTGSISLKKRLDRECETEYELLISAVGYSRQNQQRLHFKSPYVDFSHLNELVHYPMELSSTTCIRIIVLDINDNAPVFDLPDIHLFDEIPVTTQLQSDTRAYHLFIPEDVPEGTYLMTLKAHDQDAGPNALIKFSLFGKQESMFCFHTDQISGVVRLASGCDLSQAVQLRQHKLTAWAMDFGTPQLSTNMSFYVHIIPVRLNPYPPQFVGQSIRYKAWIRENVPVGTYVLNELSSQTKFQLTAIDPEGVDVQYNIIGGSGFGMFTIDDKGFISTTEMLDAESLVGDENGLWLVVQATELLHNSKYSGFRLADQLGVVGSELDGPLRAIAEVFVEVINENDHYPIPLVPYYWVDLVENSPPNTVITQVSGFDLDRSVTSTDLIYQITEGDPQGYFVIDRKSGLIQTTARILDRETILNDTGFTHLNLVVTISDAQLNPKTSEVQITINLLDVNDQSPMFYHTLPKHVQTSVGHADSPVLYFQYYEHDLSMDMLPFCIGRVFALDLDSPENASVEYGIFKNVFLQNSENSIFGVNFQSGWICAEKQLPKVGQYKLNIYAKDKSFDSHALSSGGGLDDQRPVVTTLIHILPKPNIESTESHTLKYATAPPQHIVLSERNAILGHKLFSFSIDRHGMVGSTSHDFSELPLTYLLLSENGTHHHPFGLGIISPHETTVYLAQTLDFSKVKSYHLQLVVSDGLGKLWTDIDITLETRGDVFQLLHFQLDTCNNHPQVVPVSSQMPNSSSLTFRGARFWETSVNITESLIVGSLVCTFCITESNLANLKYSIDAVGHTQTHQLFRLNERTGELRLNQPLDYEKIKDHYLLVRVQSSNSMGPGAFKQFTIHVQNANEYAPQIGGNLMPLIMPSSSFNLIDPVQNTLGLVFYLDALSSQNSTIGQITAYDPDFINEIEQSQLTFSLVAGDTIDYFDIDSSTGVIRLAKPLLQPESTQPTFDPVRSTYHQASPKCDHVPLVHQLLVMVEDHHLQPKSKTNFTLVEIRLNPGPGAFDHLECPRFTASPSHYLTVDENLQPGSVLMSVMAELDRRTAIPGFVTFGVISQKRIRHVGGSGLLAAAAADDDDGDWPNYTLFHITKDTGLLVNLVHLDRELHGDYYEVVIEARGYEGICQKMCDLLTLRIQIRDQNDNAPHIINPLFLHAHIYENAPAGTILEGYCFDKWRTDCHPSNRFPLRIETADVDSNAQLTFVISGPHAKFVRQLFEIDNATGLIVRSKGESNLDREWNLPTLVVDIRVRDGGQPSWISVDAIRLKIDVLDVNDCVPEFVQSFHMLHATVFLPAYPTEVVMQIRATDRDLDDRISYHLVSRNSFDDDDSSNQFSLGQFDGLLRIASQPNRHLENVHDLDNYVSLSKDQTYVLSIEARDSAKPLAHVTQMNLTVLVRDNPSKKYVNTKPLVVDPVGGFKLRLGHNNRRQQRLGQFSVRNALVNEVYRFITLSNCSAIVVDPLTGIVFSHPNTDGTQLALTNGTVDVLVRDSQNRMGFGQIHIAPSQPINHQPKFVGLPYFVTYCVSNERVEQSTLNPNESCNQSSFRIHATDPDFGPNGAITYSLASILPRVEPPLLGLNSSSGQLRLLRNLPSDWTRRQIEATVIALDGGGLSTLAHVHIQLIAVPHGPQFDCPFYWYSVSEADIAGHLVGTVQLNSRPSPASSLVYRIVNVKSFKLDQANSGQWFDQWSPHLNENDLVVGLENSPFALEFNTGVVRLSRSLDYEEFSHYVLLLEVMDSYTNLAARVHMVVNVTDVNDVAPAFVTSEYVLWALENVAVGYNLTVLKATDPDPGVGGQVIYHLEPHERNTSVLPFDCNSVTGQLFVSANLDFEQKQEYVFWAVASDQGSNRLQSRVPVRISIRDLNDNSPRFDMAELRHRVDNDADACFCSIRLDEQAALGTIVVRLSAHDPDSNDTLRFGLVYSKQRLGQQTIVASSMFQMDARDGIVKWMPQVNSVGKPVLVDIDSGQPVDVLDALEFQVSVTDSIHTERCIIRVELQSANWYAPQFVAPSMLQWNVSELAKVDEPLDSVALAYDSDRGVYGQISYSICGGVGRDWFNIDSDSGMIYLVQPLDRESRDQYNLLICARDGGLLSDHLDLIIRILDANDNRPQFVQPSYELTLLPHQYDHRSANRVNYPLTLPLQLKAIDADLDSNAQLVYRFFHPPTYSDENKLLEFFSINATSGRLSLESPINPQLLLNQLDQSRRHFVLLVEACDSPVASTDSVTLCSISVKVHVRFADLRLDTVPRISCISNPLFEDDELVNREVAICELIPSSNESQSWHLVSAIASPLQTDHLMSSDLFRIDNRTGQVFATKPLNFEHYASYELGIELHVNNHLPILTTNYATIVFHTDKPLNIELVDTNDCWPEFDAYSYFIDLPENYPLNTKFLRTQAVDADFNDNDVVVYSIWPVASLSPNSRQGRRVHRAWNWFSPELVELVRLFQVDSDGWISLKSPLDYELKTNHTIGIMATDSAGHWSLCEINIGVQDVNDNPPHWTVASISNTSIESMLQPNVLKRQLLTDEIEVSENWFDPTNPFVYQLNVSDPDLAVNFDPQFFLVASQSDVGSVVQSNVFFHLNATGALFLRQSLDRELASSHVLRFQVSDGLFTSSDWFVLRIHVKDVNDNAPMCMQPNRILEFAEDTPSGSILTKLNATDFDSDLNNSKISYILKSNYNGTFHVNNESGIVILSSTFDFEKVQNYSIQIDALDPGGLSCSFFIYLNVLDCNDNSPVFDPINIGPIPEDAPPGSLIGKVHARDPDSVDTNRLVYSLVGAYNSSFTIELQTGLLSINRPLDREIQPKHSLIVQVVDGPSRNPSDAPRFTSTATFAIQLLDINDSPPEFVNNLTNNRIEISEMAVVGTKLIQVKAISRDEGTNSVIRYRLLTNQVEFGLNETTGDLWLNGSLDYEKNPSYFLTIEARDQGDPPLSTTTVVTVQVLDENDHRPVFIGRVPIPDGLLRNYQDLVADFHKEYYTFSVVENSRNGTVIGKLNAVDADSGDNGLLNFSLTQLNYSSTIPPSIHFDGEQKSDVHIFNLDEALDLFHLDSATGQLSILFESDRERVQNYWFVVEVHDYGQPHFLSSLTLVNVLILDINDCAPVFEKDNYELYTEVDRLGNITGCFEIRNELISPNLFESNCVFDSYRGLVLIGRLKLTDADDVPNSGPFTCQLTNSVVGTRPNSNNYYFPSSPTIYADDVDEDDQFVVVDGGNSNGTSSQSGNSALVVKQSSHQGECLIYASPILSIGSRSIVIRANDNGLTALHTTTTVTIRVSRMSNLPPEIINVNSTLIYYRGLFNPSSAKIYNPLSPTSLFTVPNTKNLIIGRIAVRDRTAHDRLYFELLSNEHRHLFVIDQYDGTIRPGKIVLPSSTSMYHQMSSDDLEQVERQRATAASAANVVGGNSIVRLDSGDYSLRVRVTNGSLSTEADVHIKVVTITEEMLECATVLRIANLLPNLFYMENYHLTLQTQLANHLFASPIHSKYGPAFNRSYSNTIELPSPYQKHVYLLSVQESDDHEIIHRTKRQATFANRSVDVLIAIYNPKRKEFFRRHEVVQALNDNVNRLATKFGGIVEVVADLCTPQFCPRGRCQTKLFLDPNGEMNRVEVHGVSQVYPRFVVLPTCQCPAHFGGPLCDLSIDSCALANCPSPRICIVHGDDYACVCPPPRTGPNCESILTLEDKDSCYSESCFHQREYGPLQFTGGSFIHWELTNPNPYNFEMDFALRTRQFGAPLISVRWNALRSFQIRIANDGKLVVSPIGLLANHKTDFDWLKSKQPITDGHWHRIKFVFASTNMGVDNYYRQFFYHSLFQDKEGDSSANSFILSELMTSWWIELTVDGISPVSTIIDWAPGDAYQQGVLVGAELVDEFQPVQSVYDLNRIRLEPEWNLANRTATDKRPVVMRFGFVGCLRDLTINNLKPPYQLNFVSEKSKNLKGFDLDISKLFVVRKHRLEYGCHPTATISGACASGPCLHGGACLSSLSSKYEYGLPSSSYKCECPPLFHGRHCERTGDACLLAPCQNGGTCQTLHNSASNSGLASYHCTCPAGLSGLHCEQTSPIVTKDRIKVAPHDELSRQLTDLKFESGIQCHLAHLQLAHKNEHGLSSSLSSDKSKSNLHVCSNQSPCVDTPSGPRCLCHPGWHGSRCEHDVNECAVVEKFYKNLKTTNPGAWEQRRLFKWLETRSSPTGGLCSPYGSGRGYCLNTLGSYECNCSVGFSGQHCQSKSFLSLIPSGASLGLNSFQIYVIAGFLTFLFLIAMIVIVLLVCRARGLFGSLLDDHQRSSKAVNSYWAQSTHKLSSAHSSEPRLARHIHSAGGSLSGVPILTQQMGHFGTHSRYRAMPRSAATRRRTSLTSSTFGYPVSVDDSGNPLLVNGMNCSSKCGSDYAERDDASIMTNSRLVLCQPAGPGGGDQVPVMMMLSPLPPGLANRASVLSHCSPSPSVVFYGPPGPGQHPSGPDTPNTNHQSHSSQLNMEVVDPSSICLSQPNPSYMPGSQMAMLSPNHPPQFYFQPSPHQFIQLVPMRPNSIVGSDRLSLGSGSDRFSACGSQVLVQPPNVSVQYGPGGACYSQLQPVTPQMHYSSQHQSFVRSQPWTPQLHNNHQNEFCRSTSTFMEAQQQQQQQQQPSPFNSNERDFASNYTTLKPLSQSASNGTAQIESAIVTSNAVATCSNQPVLLNTDHVPASKQNGSNNCNKAVHALHSHCGPQLLVSKPDCTYFNNQQHSICADTNRENHTSSRVHPSYLNRFAYYRQSLPYPHQLGPAYCYERRAFVSPHNELESLFHLASTSQFVIDEEDSADQDGTSSLGFPSLMDMNREQLADKRRRPKSQLFGRHCRSQRVFPYRQSMVVYSNRVGSCKPADCSYSRPLLPKRWDSSMNCSKPHVIDNKTSCVVASDNQMNGVDTNQLDDESENYDQFTLKVKTLNQDCDINGNVNYHHHCNTNDNSLHVNGNDSNNYLSDHSGGSDLVEPTMNTIKLLKNNNNQISNGSEKTTIVGNGVCTNNVDNTDATNHTNSDNGLHHYNTTNLLNGDHELADLPLMDDVLVED